MQRIPGTQMSYWLGLVLREARERGHVSRNRIAQLLKVDPATLFRLEIGDTTPSAIDRYVAAYAKALDLADGRVLWERALRRWLREGSPPTLAEDLAAESGAERLEREIREARLRERAQQHVPATADLVALASGHRPRRARRSTGETPAATHRRRSGGRPGE